MVSRISKSWIPSMKEAATFYMRDTPVLTHSQKVCRLYRHLLRWTLNWCIDREVFNDVGTQIRGEFDKLKNEPEESGKVKAGVDYALNLLETRQHPDPYCIPWWPGGSSFQRNPVPPYELTYPNGIPDDIETHRVDIWAQTVKHNSPETDESWIVSTPLKSAF